MRCSHCHHEWYQEPPEDEDAPDDADIEPIPESVKPIPEGSAVPVIQIADDQSGGKDTGDKKGGFGGYIAAGVILMALLGGGYALRGPIAKTWPHSLAVYDIVDAAPTLPGEGLVIDRLRAEVVSENSGLNMLKVNGYIINLTEKPIAVPPVRATLRRSEEDVIDSWLLSPEKPTLSPGEELSFLTTYPTPPSDAKEVNIRFEPFASVKELKTDGEVTVTPEPAHQDSWEEESIDPAVPPHDAAMHEDPMHQEPSHEEPAHDAPAHH